MHTRSKAELILDDHVTIILVILVSSMKAIFTKIVSEIKYIIFLDIFVSM